MKRRRFLNNLKLQLFINKTATVHWFHILFLAWLRAGPGHILIIFMQLTSETYSEPLGPRIAILDTIDTFCNELILIQTSDCSS